VPRQLPIFSPRFTASPLRSLSDAWQRAIHASLNPGRSHRYLLTPATRGRLDVRTHCGGGYRRRSHAVRALSDTTAELEQILELAIKHKGLSRKRRARGRTAAPAVANRDDLFDLRKCQTEAGRLLDEVQHPDSVVNRRAGTGSRRASPAAGSALRS